MAPSSISISTAPFKVITGAVVSAVVGASGAELELPPPPPHAVSISTTAKSGALMKIIMKDLTLFEILVCVYYLRSALQGHYHKILMQHHVPRKHGFPRAEG